MMEYGDWIEQEAEEQRREEHEVRVERFLPSPARPVEPHQIESLDGFQNVDSSKDWLAHDPSFEWTAEDLLEFHREEDIARQEQEAMAGWWDMEGVRCATFGRNPQQNPYR